MRKTYLDNLPRGGQSQNGACIPKTNINWSKCIGERINFIYDDIEGEFEIIDIKIENSRTKLLCRYNKKDVLLDTGGIINCRLGNLLNLKTKDYKVKIGAHFKDTNRNMTIISREIKQTTHGKSVVAEKHYNYKCNECEYQGIIEESALLKGRGCPVCCKTPRKVIKGINDIATTATWMITYIKNKEDAFKYTYSSNKMIEFVCPICGQVKSMSINKVNLYKGIGCKMCGDGVSYPEKIMISVLQQLNIQFISEYSPKWIAKKRFDFYIPSMNLIIEMDGGFHYRDNNMTNQSVEDVRKIDDYKTQKANERNIEVVRIDCRLSEIDYIKNSIIKSDLKNKLNINEINWEECERKTYTSLIKEIYQYKKANPYLTTTDIGNIFHYDQSTIRRWLKKGEFIWKEHVYDVENEKCLWHIKRAKTQGKAVSIYKDDIWLGTFYSAGELERKSEELFGVKLSNQKINAVANGKRKHHKGYIFKFVKEE